MAGKDRLHQLQRVIRAKQKELGITREQSARYRWVADVLRKKSQTSPEPKQPETPSRLPDEVKFKRKKNFDGYA